MEGTRALINRRLQVLNRLTRRSFLLGGAAALTGSALAAQPAPPVVMLAKNGRATMPIIVASGASERVRQAASTLAHHLGRITGAGFEVIVNTHRPGIAVGLADDFSNRLASPVELDRDDPTAREDYLLRSHRDGLVLAGSTELAVEHAVWDLLHRLGYRQYFPNERWEIIPQAEELAVAVDAYERPDYYARRIWYGYGLWDYNKAPYESWCARNRATSGIILNSGHAYGGILKRNQEVFERHPEYLGLVDGQRVSDKFCISNPGLRKLVADHALRRFEEKPDLDSISVEPSDGGGWCECDECAALGTITDRAVLLANEVAAAVNERYPGKFVGMYAYNQHSPPPNIAVHRQVIISIATAFIEGGRSLDQIIAGWSAKCEKFGIREYYSVNPWDRDQPAAARGGNIDYLRRTIPAFHADGARFMSAEASDNWGPNGLGYYLAARLLWDVNESEKIEDLIEDFLTRAFGNAKEPMRAFYEQLDGSLLYSSSSSSKVNRVMRALREAVGLIDNQLARMFSALRDALVVADDPAVESRIGDLILYARYVDLYAQYSRARGSARQDAFEALVRHAYRMRTTMLVHTKALYRDLHRRDESVRVPPEAAWDVEEELNPWKSSRPFGADEIRRYLQEGLQRYAVAPVAPIAFSNDLTTTDRMALASVEPGFLGAASGTQTFYTHVGSAPAALKLTVAATLSSASPGTIRVRSWRVDDANQSVERSALMESRVPADGEEHPVELLVSEKGVYKIVVDDGGGRTLVKWESTLPFTLRSSLDLPMNDTYDLWNLYFYVPRQTKVLSLYGGHHGEVRDSAGRTVFWLNGREAGFYHVAVPSGEDGTLWSIRYGRGAVRLLTVPPYFARVASELLLPSEVAARDAMAVEP